MVVKVQMEFHEKLQELRKQRGLTQEQLAEKLSVTCDSLYEKCQNLSEMLKNVPAETESAVPYFGKVITTAMAELRKDADLLEQLTDKSYWPYPTYSDLLFY